ncbi:hypothetical protein [Minwuia sp.]|uniref:hypothetical protein n=1 Tax=Minwuia sp. TaxID=2493630 RepID=UPI003A8F8D4C
MDRLLETFVTDARAAAVSDEPTSAVRGVLEDALTRADAFAALIAAQADDEVHLFEDETVSIWTCRFWPDVILPPHEHTIPVHIGVVGGVERNILYRRLYGELLQVFEKEVGRGDMLSMGADGIHAVTAAGPDPSLALHVYLGPLMQVERSLFNWRTGAAMPFTDANFEAMKRSSRAAG